MESSVSIADTAPLAPPVPASAVLVTLCDQVETVKASVAREFMALAEVLQANSQRARQLTAASHHATGFRTSERSIQSIAALQGILTDSAGISGMVEVSTEKMSEILARVHDIAAPLRRLTRMSTLLQIVSVLCRIEGGRLTSGLADIVTLSQDIDTLSAEIEQHINAILADSSSLFTLLQTGVHELDRVGRQERLSTNNLIQRTQALLGPALARSEASRLAALTIDKQYVSFHRATDRVVISLQAEDRARQRLEQVQEALQRMTTALDSGASVASCADMLILQRAQLASTRDLISGAAHSIHSGLQSLSPRIQTLVSQTATLARQTDNDGQSFAALIDSGLETVAEVFRQCSSSAEAVITIVDNVVPSVEQMTTRARALEAIEISVRLISLNATVRTAQLGGEGAAMDVLASELHTITTERGDDTTEVLANLRSIADALATINLGRSTTRASTILAPGSAGLITQELAGLSRAIRSASRELALGLEEVEHLSAALCSDLARGMSIAIRAAAITGAFDTLLASFDDAFDQLGINSDRIAAPPLHHPAEDLSKLYAMQSQRDLQRQIFGVEDANRAAVPSPPTGKARQFGDDIELF